MNVTKELEKSSFEILAGVNVNAHVEKKNGLSYLSWAWALDQLMRQDPQAEWEYPEPKMFGETMMVYCTVRAFGKSKTAHLPVMDYRNKPIPNPDAFQVNTAMQRCLVKAIALHGLGLYIYAGEDLPATDNAVVDAVIKADAKPLSGVKEQLQPEQVKKVDEIAGRVSDWLINGSVEDAVLETENSNMDTDEKAYFWTLFDSKERAAMKKEHARIRKQYAADPATQV